MIIIFSGKAGVGKDYIAHEFVDTLYSDYHKYVACTEYAEALRKELDNINCLLNSKKPESLIAKAFNITRKDIDKIKNWEQGDYTPDYCFEDHSRTGYRKVLQYYGTEVRRKQDPTYWIKKTIKHIHDLIDYTDPDVVIIKDARFVNEISEIRANFNNVLAVHLIDSSKGTSERLAKRSKSDMTKEEKEHSSETSLDKWKGFNITYDRAKMSTKDIVEDLVRNTTL